MIAIRPLLTPLISLAALLAVAGITRTAVAGADSRTATRLTVIASGFDNPRGLTFGPDGCLYVAEGGRGGPTPGFPVLNFPLGPVFGGKTGRISRICDGVVSTVVDQLPSARLAVGYVVSVADVEFLDGALYALIAGGGPERGNPEWTNGLVRVDGGSVTPLNDYHAYVRANPVGRPDPRDNAPGGMPYSMVAIADGFYMVDGNQSSVVRMDLDGTIARVSDSSERLGQIVPVGSVLTRNHRLLVSSMAQVPHVDHFAHVFEVMNGGDVRIEHAGLTAAIGLTFDRRGSLYVLEMATGNLQGPPFLLPGTGRVLRIGRSGRAQTVVTGLTFPTAMTFGADDMLYISNKGSNLPPGSGEIVRVRARGAHDDDD